MADMAIALLPTHVAAMIYYRKALFGRGPKLTAVQYDAKSFLQRIFRLI
jgi:hypothetical protein